MIGLEKKIIGFTPSHQPTLNTYLMDEDKTLQTTRMTIYGPLAALIYFKKSTRFMQYDTDDPCSPSYASASCGEKVVC